MPNINLRDLPAPSHHPYDYDAISLIEQVVDRSQLAGLLGLDDMKLGARVTVHRQGQSDHPYIVLSEPGHRSYHKGELLHNSLKVDLLRSEYFGRYTQDDIISGLVDPMHIKDMNLSDMGVVPYESGNDNAYYWTTATPTEGN